jgi:peptide-methionine (R)-S-oxide reductase
MSELTRRGLIFGAAAAAAAGVFGGFDRIASFSLAPGEPQPDSDAAVELVQFDASGRRIGTAKADRIRRTPEEWRRRLTAAQYAVARQGGTEIPYSGELLGEHRAGIFRCACCGTALFDSRAKFESGTGWPSFWAAIAGENIREKADFSLGMSRREVRCALCDAHLGHVFSDGPDPTGLRYCINSAALRFAAAAS